MKRLRVGVIYGGRSGEHEVSLASAAAVFAHLDRQRYEPVPIRIEKDGRWALAERAPSAMSAAEVIEHARLEAGRAPRAAREVHLMARPSDEPLLSIDRVASRGAGGERKGAIDRGDGDGAVVQSMGLDVVFPVLHGPYGEDGTVQGLLELANLPYVGCGVLASAVGMDKAMMKVVFAQHGLPQVDHAVVLRSEWARNRAGVREGLLAKLPMPLFVKPANLGLERRHLEGPRRRRARRGPRPRRRLRSQDRRRGRRRATPARSSAPSSATTRPRRRSPARWCRRASSTTTRRSISTRDRRRSSRPT